MVYRRVPHSKFKHPCTVVLEDNVSFTNTKGATIRTCDGDTYCLSELPGKTQKPNLLRTELPGKTQ